MAYQFAGSNQLFPDFVVCAADPDLKTKSWKTFGKWQWRIFTWFHSFLRIFSIKMSMFSLIWLTGRSNQYPTLLSKFRICSFWLHHNNNYQLNLNPWMYPRAIIYYRAVHQYQTNSLFPNATVCFMFP